MCPELVRVQLHTAWWLWAGFVSWSDLGTWLPGTIARLTILKMDFLHSSLLLPALRGLPHLVSWLDIKPQDPEVGKEISYLVLPMLVLSTSSPHLLPLSATPFGRTLQGPLGNSLREEAPSSSHILPSAVLNGLPVEMAWVP